MVSPRIYTCYFFPLSLSISLSRHPLSVITLPYYSLAVKRLLVSDKTCDVSVVCLSKLKLTPSLLKPTLNLHLRFHIICHLPQSGTWKLSKPAIARQTVYFV